MIELLASLFEEGGIQKLAEKALSNVKFKGKDIVDLLKNKSITKEDLKKVGTRKVVNNLKQMAPKEVQQIIDRIKQNQVKESDTTELILNFNGELGLSSSFLQYGIFNINPENKNEGDLILAIDGKEYDFGTIKTSIWIAMVNAKGKDGSGAGSILWNTIWYNKRTNSKTTGGVAGSIKNLIKSRKRIYAQLARNQKYINQFEISKRLFSKSVVVKKPNTNIATKVKNIFKKYK